MLKGNIVDSLIYLWKYDRTTFGLVLALMLCFIISLIYAIKGIAKSEANILATIGISISFFGLMFIYGAYGEI